MQVSFPVTERTNFRLSYAHQVQAPDFGLILGGINTDLSVTNTNHFYGSDLDFGKTITFEFGIRHSFSDDMVLDISAYNKDKLSDAAGRLVSFYDPFKQAPVDIRVVTNADFGNARGIDIRFDRRFGELFNGTLAYTFEDAKNTGSDPSTYINFGSRVLNASSGGNNPPPQAILTTDQNRPHNLAGQLAPELPRQLASGFDRRGDFPERGCVSPPSASPAVRRTPAARAIRVTKTCCPAPCAPSGSRAITTAPGCRCSSSSI